MKRVLMLLAALMTFMACDTDEEPAIDYSTWTTEELLADPNGIDYLVKTAGEVNYDALNEQLKAMMVLVIPGAENHYAKRDGKWVEEEMLGISTRYCLLMDDGTYRRCYSDMAHQFGGKRGYYTGTVGNDPIAQFLGLTEDGDKIVAVVGQSLIVENHKGTRRYIAYVKDCRQWVLENYTVDFMKYAIEHGQ